MKDNDDLPDAVEAAAEAERRALVAGLYAELSEVTVALRRIEYRPANGQITGALADAYSLRTTVIHRLADEYGPAIRPAAIARYLGYTTQLVATILEKPDDNPKLWKNLTEAALWRQLDARQETVEAFEAERTRLIKVRNGLFAALFNNGEEQKAIALAAGVTAPVVAKGRRKASG